MMMAAAGADNFWYVKTDSQSPNAGNLNPGGLDVDSSGVVYAVSTVTNDSRRTMILKKVQDGAPPTVNQRITVHSHSPYGSSYGDPTYNYRNCQLFNNDSTLHIDGFGTGPYGYPEFKIYRYNTDLTQNQMFNDGAWRMGHNMVSTGSSGSGYDNRLYPVGGGSALYYNTNFGHVRENGDFWVQGTDGYYAYIGAMIEQTNDKLNNFNAAGNKQSGSAYSTSSYFREDAAGHCIAVDNDNDYVYWAGTVGNSGSPNFYSAYPFMFAGIWDSTNEIFTNHPQMSYPVSPQMSGFSGGNKYNGSAIAVGPADSNGNKWAYAVWNENYSYYRRFYYQRLKLTSTGKTVEWASNEISSLSTSEDKWLWDAKIDSQDNFYVLFSYDGNSTGGLVLWKFNSSGTYEWSRTFEASNTNNFNFCDAAAEASGNRRPFASKMVIDSNDNIYIHTGAKGQGSTTGWHNFLIKYPSDGSLTGNFGDLSIVTSGPYPSSNLSWATSSGQNLYTPNFGSSFFKDNPDSSNYLKSDWAITQNSYNTNSRTTSNNTQLIA